MDRLKTDFLTASSSFLAGIGSVLNLNGRLYDYNASETPDETAIASDWEIVGQDLSDALEKAFADLPDSSESDCRPDAVACE